MKKSTIFCQRTQSCLVHLLRRHCPNKFLQLKHDRSATTWGINVVRQIKISIFVSKVNIIKTKTKRTDRNFWSFPLSDNYWVTLERPRHCETEIQAFKTSWLPQILTQWPNLGSSSICPKVFQAFKYVVSQNKTASENQLCLLLWF